jgi:hypothetical protein
VYSVTRKRTVFSVHVMKVCRAVVVEVHSFLNSTVGGELVALDASVALQHPPTPTPRIPIKQENRGVRNWTLWEKK